jgi:hypothetical protein
MVGWSLLVDFGEERIVVGSTRGEGVRVVEFGGFPWTPSAVHWTDSDGIAAGRDGSGAERIGGRLGERELALGTRSVAMRDAVGALLAHAMRRAAEGETGSSPSSLWITGPAATRGGHEAEILLGAASQLGIREVHFVGEPEAVAASVPAKRLHLSDRVAVFALAPSRCLIAVVDRRPDGIRLVSARAEDGTDALGETRIRDMVEALADVARAHGPVGAVALAGADAETPLLHSLIVELLGVEPEPGDAATTAVHGLGELARGAVRAVADDDSSVPPAEGVPASLAAEEMPLEALEAQVDVAPEPAATEQEPLDDDVQFTVYRPRCVRPGRWYTALVFAHRTEPVADDALGGFDPIEAVREQAVARLGDDASAYVTASQDSAEGIPRGSLLTFEPRVEGVRFNPERRTISWQEPVHLEEFRLEASSALPPGTRRGSLSVYRGVILIADVNLSIRVGDAELPAVASHARPYRKIFLSYSHLDRGIAEQVEQIHAAVGDEPLRDERILRSGEVWNERIEQMIRDAQIFQLFWSTNSMRSRWVTKEWRYALALARPNFVRPTYWEQPMPSAPAEGLPPAELSCLHFSPLRLRVEVASPESRSTMVARHAGVLQHGPAGHMSAGISASAPPPPPATPPPASSGATSSQRRSVPARRRWRALSLGGPLAAVLVVGVVASTLIGGAVSGTHPASQAPQDQETRATTTGAPAELPGGSSCASCQPGGPSCPHCVTASGTGSFDLGAIQSNGGLLTWKSRDGAPLTILLEGRPVSSGAASGHVPLPRHSYADLAVETEGVWSVVIH